MGIRELRAKHLEAFEEFWTNYPRHTERQRAFDVFIRVAEEGFDLQKIISKAKSYANNVDPNKLQYVSAAHRWLDGERWDDEDLFTDQKVANREWFVKVYKESDAAAVEKRLGFIFPDPPIPDGCVDVQSWHRDARKSWIGAVARHVLYGEPLPE